MAEYSLTTPTPVPVDGAVPYNNVITRSCENIHHREGSGIVRVKGGHQHPSKYLVVFNANVTGVIGSIQLGLFLDGELLPETLMSVSPVAEANVLTVNTATEILVGECWSTITARVITGDTVTVNTANIIVHKEVA